MDCNSVDRMQHTRLVLGVHNQQSYISASCSAICTKLPYIGQCCTMHMLATIKGLPALLAQSSNDIAHRKQSHGPPR